MITVTLNGISLVFHTAETLFSPHRPDRGTLAMLRQVVLSPGDKLLDLGCGYGLAGIYAAKCIGAANVVMSDIDPLAVEMAKKNAAENGAAAIKTVVSDGFSAITDTGFTHILSNPPYHVDFSVPKHFIEKGFNRLAIGGKLYMVTKRRDWYKNKIAALFGGVSIVEEDGYFIFSAERRQARYSRR